MAPRKRPNENVSENQSKKKTRGASLLKDLTKGIGNGNRLPVEFNKTGQPIGQNRSKLSSYVGTVVKKWVPITVDDWRLVTQEERDNIWESVSNAFVIPHNRKHWVLKKANDLWGNFKKDLGRFHMKNKETGEFITEPPSIYDSYITQDQWTEFIRIRQSEEFKAKSLKFGGLSQLSRNTYRASRKGYVGVEAEYRAEHSLDSSSDVPRSIVWIEARKGKNGEISQEAKPVIERLHHLMEQEKSGELTTVGQKDVLAMALNKPEHPGRVRGVGQDVTIREYWPHSSKRASSSNTTDNDGATIAGLKDHIKEMEATFSSKISEMENVIRKLVSERGLGAAEGHPLVDHVMITPENEAHCPKSGKASCSALKKVDTTSKELEWQSCELFWPDLNQVVARGKLYISSKDGGFLHNRPLESGYVKVEVITLIKADVEVPKPSDEVAFVRDAVGQFIAWPENLAIPIETRVHERDVEKSKAGLKGKSLTYESVIGPTEMESEASNMEKYHWILDEFSGNKVRQINLATGIFQYKHSGLDIGKEEIERILDGKELGACHVMLYVRYLFDSHCNRIKAKLKFICPTQVSPLGQSIDQRALYVANCMEGNVQNMLYVAPYYFRYHWVLIVMNPHLGSAYWIDPRHGKIEKDVELLVATSYRLKYNKMSKKTPRTKTLWHVIQCPHQKSVIDCGYYVLKFMRKIVISQKQYVTMTNQWYDSKTTYNHEDIDDIRREWMDYFLSLI